MPSRLCTSIHFHSVAVEVAVGDVVFRGDVAGQVSACLLEDWTLAVVVDAFRQDVFTWKDMPTNLS